MKAWSVKSTGGLGALAASGPSPLPLSPWHRVQFAWYRALPRSSSAGGAVREKAYATTSQRWRSERLAKGGMNFSRLPWVTWVYQRAGVDWRASSVEPIAATGLGSCAARGPSPIPVSPWQGAHFSAKVALPLSGFGGSR